MLVFVIRRIQQLFFRTNDGICASSQDALGGENSRGDQQLLSSEGGPFIAIGWCIAKFFKAFVADEWRKHRFELCAGEDATPGAFNGGRAVVSLEQRGQFGR
jgi:hypothetical protein